MIPGHAALQDSELEFDLWMHTSGVTTRDDLPATMRGLVLSRQSRTERAVVTGRSGGSDIDRKPSRGPSSGAAERWVRDARDRDSDCHFQSTAGTIVCPDGPAVQLRRAPRDGQP